MFPAFSTRYANLSTPAKLLVSLTLALLPIGAPLIWSAVHETREAQRASEGEANAHMLNAARAAESLIGRNALALRIAASGAIDPLVTDACANAAKSLQITPEMARQFTLVTHGGVELCGHDDFREERAGQQVPAGGVDVWIDRQAQGIMLRVGVAEGMATSRIDLAELRKAAEIAGRDITSFAISDGERSLTVIPDRSSEVPGGRSLSRRIDVANAQLVAVATDNASGVTLSDRMLILLPVLMWAAATLVSMMVVSRLLLRPLARLRDSVSAFDPDTDDFVLPDRLGPSSEIRGLGESFKAAVQRIRDSEAAMVTALEGQRRLVHEVHHRVKNNLQVIVSLLNIHGRAAATDDARSAYAGIGRRVEALAVVHRNHFAEVEEHRGVGLRPLLTELAAGLRASTANPGDQPTIDLEIDACFVTQDVAVAIAFLVTEIVDFALGLDPAAPIAIGLKRDAASTAQLTITGSGLARGDDTGANRDRFERIVEGLARQLRAPLEKRPDRFSINVPIMPSD